IGVNTHAADYTKYANWTAVKSAISDLGIRYVRDDPGDVARLNDLTAATGAKICLIMQDGFTNASSIDMSKLPGVMDRARQTNNILYLEGPNEHEQFGPNWAQELRDWQTAMYTQAKADSLLAGKPVLAPTVGNQFADVSDLNAYLDMGNLHHYAYFDQ